VTGVPPPPLEAQPPIGPNPAVEVEATLPALSVSACTEPSSPMFRASLQHVAVVGRCRLTVPNPELKARLVSALETVM
jgi:hypothetical protein